MNYLGCFSTCPLGVSPARHSTIPVVTILVPARLGFGLCQAGTMRGGSKAQVTYWLNCFDVRSAAAQLKQPNCHF